MSQAPQGYGTINDEPQQELTPNDEEMKMKLSIREIVALLAICSTHMGDAVEIYLPAILTQDISCDLQLSPVQQGILSVVFYSFYATGETWRENQLFDLNVISYFDEQA